MLPRFVWREQAASAARGRPEAFAEPLRGRPQVRRNEGVARAHVVDPQARLDLATLGMTRVRGGSNAARGPASGL